MSKKILCIGDVHDRIPLIDLLLSKYETNYDQIIFLGDFFDSFEGDVKEAERTAYWLKESLNKPNRIHIRGNHDEHYRYPNNYNIRGSGYTKNKALTINRIMSYDDWSKMKYFYEAEGFIFSHAGFNKNQLHPVTGWDTEYINKMIQDDESHLRSGEDSLLFCVGRSRGGYAQTGGITWQCWSEFEPVQGLAQIVGHTAAPIIRHYRGNYCVDSLPHEVLSIEDGVCKRIKITLEGK